MVYFSHRPVRALVIGLIRLYQKTLSFDHGALSLFFPEGFCRFHPTCSEYAIQSIERFGLLRGGSRALYRIIRCNPFNRGGYDPVH